MNLIALLNDPLALAIIWAFIALVALAVQALPEPTPTSSLFYRWMYGFLHLVGTNWPNILKAFAPPLVKK